MLIQSSSVLTVSGVDFSVGMCLIIMPQTLRRTESPADRFHAEPVPVWNSKRHRALTTQHIYNTINSITHLNRGHLGNKRAGDRQWNHQELCCNKKRNKIYLFVSSHNTTIINEQLQVVVILSLKIFWIFKILKLFLRIPYLWFTPIDFCPLSPFKME